MLWTSESTGMAVDLDDALAWDLLQYPSYGLGTFRGYNELIRPWVQPSNNTKALV